MEIFIRHQRNFLKRGALVSGRTSEVQAVEILCFTVGQQMHTVLLRIMSAANEFS